MEHTIVSASKFNAWFDDNHVVKDVSIEIEKNQVIAVMGPSGCGKTTFLRCINRMHELIPGATAKGSLKLYSDDVYTMNPDGSDRHNVTHSNAWESAPDWGPRP